MTAFFVRTPADQPVRDYFARSATDSQLQQEIADFTPVDSTTQGEGSANGVE